MRRSIEGMDTIREQIQETAKRIKRLGESSQEIGDIIGLINDIAEQTNVLALNAAIQASAAGEAGRGFAVVADEVQRLAERSSGATRQVEGLVKAIQADTSEAVSSMEQSTANVVSGAEMAQAAGWIHRCDGGGSRCDGPCRCARPLRWNDHAGAGHGGPRTLDHGAHACNRGGASDTTGLIGPTTGGSRWCR